MFQRILLKTHWLLGITLGLVLVLMGATGALMSFQDEIVNRLSPATIEADQIGGQRLSPDEIAAAVEAAAPGGRIGQLVMSSDPRSAVEVRMRSRQDDAPFYVDPYDGRVLGRAVGQDFFHLVEQLHRFLALPATPGSRDSAAGRQLTGAAALSLVFFALSGLYLRWPRRTLDWRAWLVVDLRRTGHNLYRSLHVVVGTWLVACYLLSAGTGLWWSYGWYRTMLGGQMHDAPEGGGRPAERAHEALSTDAASAPRRGAGDSRPNGAEEPMDRARAGRARDDDHVEGSRRRWADGPRTPSLNAAWQEFVALAGPDFGTATVGLSRDRQFIEVARRVRGSARARLADRYDFDPQRGVLIKTESNASRPWSDLFADNPFALHDGSIFGLPGRILMMFSSAALPVFGLTGWLMYLSRRRRQRESALAKPEAMTDAGSDVLVAYASQTGTAERIAHETAAAFSAIGQPVRLAALAKLQPQDVVSARWVLLVVSTYADGQAPDPARAFARRMVAAKLDAVTVRYAVLALGDREYPDFCRFGREVEEWLRAAGAEPLFPIIEMDSQDESSEQAWYAQLSQFGVKGADVRTRTEQAETAGGWTLDARTWLNPGSAGTGVFHLRLTPHGQSLPAWRAGDLLEIAPENTAESIGRFIRQSGLDAGMSILGKRLDAWLASVVLPEPDSVRGRSLEPLEGWVKQLRKLAVRTYSIASIPSNGTVDLLVRQVVKPLGELGIGSGWLTQGLRKGSLLSARVRRHAAFHAPAESGQLVLIGNGTGLAGLMAHVRAAREEGRSGHWLIFGERNEQYDAFFRTELQAWLADGTLARADFVYSRDQQRCRYVQDRVGELADDIGRCVEVGAAILVCGSLGMAEAVQAALARTLGSAWLETLVEMGRYRRDAY